MSHKNRLSRAGIVALSLGFAVLSAPAFAQSADRSDYYASIGNPHPELPGFPTHTFDTFHKEHYYQKNLSGLHSKQAELLLQFRTVPGQTLQSLTADLTPARWLRFRQQDCTG